MFDQDILFAQQSEDPTLEGQWVAFLITPKGRAYARRTFSEDRINTTAGVETIPLGDQKAAYRFYARARYKRDLDVHYCGDYMGFSAALLNARVLVTKQKQRADERAIDDHFSPILFALYGEHNDPATPVERQREIRRQITQTFRIYPDVIGRTMLRSGIMFGKDSLSAVLNQTGITMDNWHEA